MVELDFANMHQRGWSPAVAFTLGTQNGLSRLETFKAILDNWGTAPFRVTELEGFDNGTYPSASARAAATVGLAAVVLNYPQATADDFAEFEARTGISRKVVALARADRADDALRFYDRLETDRLFLRALDERDARRVVALAADPIEQVAGLDDSRSVATFDWGWAFTVDDEVRPPAGDRPSTRRQARAMLVDRFTGALIELADTIDLASACARYGMTGWPDQISEPTG